MVVDRGEIVAQGPMRSLLARLDVEGFVFDVEGTLPAVLPAIEGMRVHAVDDHSVDVEMPRSMIASVRQRLSASSR